MRVCYIHVCMLRTYLIAFLSVYDQLSDTSIARVQLAEGIGSAQKEYVMLTNIKELVEDMPVSEKSVKLSIPKETNQPTDEVKDPKLVCI